MLIALDRQERGSGAQSAADDVRREFGLPVLAIASLDDLLAWIGTRDDLVQHRDSLAGLSCGLRHVPCIGRSLYSGPLEVPA